jgi:phosphate transport system permease protein
MINDFIKKRLSKTKGKRPERFNKVYLFEKIFQRFLGLSGIILIIILLSIFITLVFSSMPSIRALGFHFIWGKDWDPVTDEYGALPFLIGTLLTSILALIIAFPFSISTAIFLGEYFPKGFISNLFKNLIDLLASIPSVIYGFWGIFVLVPIVRDVELKFGLPPYGV